MRNKKPALTQKIQFPPPYRDCIRSVVEVKLTFWARLRYLLGNSLQVETAILVEHAPGKLQSHSVARVVKAAKPPQPTPTPGVSHA
jgi:hypothetical protein